MEKISVIAIIYKVEKYLRKCLDSLINQTYPDLEIILVDDGSPDNCPAICDEYAAKHNNIKVIHKENGGAPYARNSGLEIITGKYFTFLDTDDYLDPDMYEILYNSIKKHDADISLCAARNVFYNKTTEPVLPQKEEIIDNKEFVRRAVCGDPIVNSVPWNKLYKTEIFQDIRFNKQAWDDLNYFITLLPRVKKAVIINAVKYNYVQRESSVSKLRFNRNKLAVLNEKDRMESFLKDNYPEFLEYIKKEKFNVLLQLIYMCNISEQNAETRKIRKELEDMLNAESKKIKKYLTLKEKLTCFTAVRAGGIFKIAAGVYRKRRRKEYRFFKD